MSPQDPKQDNDFAAVARRRRHGRLAEFAAFLAHNKRWWLIPLLVPLLLLGMIILLGGTPLAPFIYTLF